jgi:ABC-2 type transport system permease protein
MINLSRIIADFLFFGRVYLRDRIGLFFTIIFPVILIITFGTIFLGGSSGSTTVYVQNLDGGQISRQFITALKKISNLELVPIGNSENMSSYLAAHSSSDGLFIPPNFSADFMTGKSTKVTVYGNPTALSSAVVSGTVNAVINEFNLRRVGGSPVAGMYQTTVKGQSFTYIDFLVPGLIGFSILTSPMFSLVSVSSLYKKLKLFKQLSLTPLSKEEWLLSKILWHIFLGIVSFVLMVGVSAFGFGAHAFLSVWLIPFLILGPMFFASLGMVIGIVAKTVENSSIIGQVIIFPMMFLSGTFFPISYMPTYIQNIAHALPLFYVIEGLNAVMIYSNYSQAAVDIVVITALTLGMLVAAVKLFKWRED